MKSIILMASFALSISTMTLHAEINAKNNTRNGQDFLQNYAAITPASRAAWPGFDPDSVPKIIIERNGANKITSIITIDHPNPDALGEAIPFVWEGDEGRSALVTNPHENAALSQVANYEFNIDVAGAPSFVVASNCFDSDWQDDCMADGEFAVYVMHELFHRYQDEVFQRPMDVDQQVYDFSAENLKLALLENTILQQMNADTAPSETVDIAKKLVVVRIKRHALTPVVKLDEQQERFEGTARYIEHQTADIVGGNYGRNAYTSDLAAPMTKDDIQSEFGFGRFYATGATMMLILEKLGVPDAKQKIMDGASPMEVITKEMNLSAQEQEKIMKDLLTEHDSDGALSAKGAKLAEDAKTGARLWE